MAEENIVRKIIDEVCREKSIEKITLSYDWVIILKKGNVEKKIVNYKFHLNSKRSSEIARDKYSTYAVLKYYGIPVIEHHILFNEERVPGCEGINQNFAILKNDEKVVIKANSSSEGKDVFLCYKEEEKLVIVKRLFKEENDAVCVSPFMDIAYEYRAIFLDGEVIYLYKKKKPYVEGDGKLTVKELVEKDLKYLTELIEEKYANYVPEKGEKVMVGWKHNLSGGAVPIVIDEQDEYYAVVKSLAEKVGKVMELTYASVDIVVTQDKKMYVMEVNSTVCVTKFCELVPNGFEIGKKIYEKVIDKLFED